MNTYQQAKNTQTDIFLGDLEKRAFESNVAFGVYDHAKSAHGTRPDLTTLSNLIKTGAADIGGHEYRFDTDTGQAYADNAEIAIKPLYEGLIGTVDFDYIKQRKAYLTENMASQARFIEYDAKGSINTQGQEVNTEFAKAQVRIAQDDMLPDNENIQVNAFFKTEMTAAQKMRYMSTTIDTLKKEVKANLRKLAIKEKADISQPLFDKQSAAIAKDIFDGKLDALEAARRHNSHEISADHNFFKSGLRGIEGLNNSDKFHIGHLKPMPAGYITQKERTTAHLKIEYGDDDSRLKIISRQLEAFINTKGVLSIPNPVDFSVGTDLNRLYVDTKKMVGGNVVDGKSCVLDADNAYHNVKQGEFALPVSSMLSKPLSHYDAMVLTTGPINSAAISTALADKNVLVVDALKDTNINNVLTAVRQENQIPVVLFTDSNDLHDFINSNKDKNICSNLSKDSTWGENALYNIREGTFDNFKSNIENIVAISLEPPKKEEPQSILKQLATYDAHIIKHIEPITTPNINRHRVGL